MDAPQPPPGIEVAPGVRIAPGELHFSFSRSGGPGGQNVNKVSTKVELRLHLAALKGLSPRALERLKFQQARRLLLSGEMQIICDEERSQERNRQGALERLREMIVHAQIEPKPRRKTKPTRGSKEDRLKSKHARSEIKKQRSRNFE
jgi:ribosome-associated protein